MPKKRRLVEVQLSITLDRKPTEAELDGLKKIFPKANLTYLERWERETKI